MRTPPQPWANAPVSFAQQPCSVAYTPQPLGGRRRWPQHRWKTTHAAPLTHALVGGDPTGRRRIARRCPASHGAVCVGTDPAVAAAVGKGRPGLAALRFARPPAPDDVHCRRRSTRNYWTHHDWRHCVALVLTPHCCCGQNDVAT